MAEAARIIKHNGMKVTGYCRGGLFGPADAAGQQALIDDNKRMIDEGAAIGADCLVMIGGGLAPGSRDIKAARGRYLDGMAKNPAACARLQGRARGRAVAPDVCRRPRLHLAARGARGVRPARRRDRRRGRCLSPWWDPNLAQSIARAKGRILAHHICDWLVPTKDILLDRGMMGDGVIDLPAIRRMVEAAGFHGYQEVEIFSAEDWWKRPGDEVIRTCIERYNTVC